MIILLSDKMVKTEIEKIMDVVKNQNIKKNLMKKLKFNWLQYA
jgi:hypothetical protein